MRSASSTLPARVPAAAPSSQLPQAGSASPSSRHKLVSASRDFSWKNTYQVAPDASYFHGRAKKIWLAPGAWQGVDAKENPSHVGESLLRSEERRVGKECLL